MARQCARVRHLAEGDANTRYFHILARGKKKRIFIPHLNVGGVQVAEHESMEQALFAHFQSVFGSKAHWPHGLNLSELGYSASDLSSLHAPFTEEEVWEAIKDMPGDRAPGPDGFIGVFYKTAWHIIKPDVIGRPRRVSPRQRVWIQRIKQRTHRPPAKEAGRELALVSKLLAVRLAAHLHGLVSCNQTAFVWGRVLHDSYKFVQAAAAHFRKKKIPVPLLKIDISKAFDTISWKFLLDVLQALGFSQRWRDWVAILLSLASSSILVNGMPGRKILHRRGVRQGDSLFPMLFILAMDAFNRLVDRAGRRGILSKLGYHCSLYADDVILFVSSTTREAVRVKRLLEVFGNASGLVANLGKCSISTVATDEEVTSNIAAVLGCRVAPFPLSTSVCR
ncbi:hypothetical protein U9M48_042196 [Paspalum notatum var. saurae]|uniref:Reverse transcriptase domain-containing protein n=1 Tax=Paspalum notatum var. saurae TaxID=547442 RepID=A0AAQ3UWH6_PASNO